MPTPTHRAAAEAIETLARTDPDVVDGAIHGLICEHRTHQQDFWRTIQRLAHMYQHHDSDLRNEGAVEFAKGIASLKVMLPRL